MKRLLRGEKRSAEKTAEDKTAEDKTAEERRLRGETFPRRDHLQGEKSSGENTISIELFTNCI